MVPLIIVGPTASGKSARALQLAQDQPSTIINADSMQIYAGLPILTAQPLTWPEDAPHVLYGYRAVDHAATAAAWAEDAVTATHHSVKMGRRPIIVGGTGLYINTLRHGLSPIPSVPEEIRAATRALLAEIGPAALHTRLRAYDPVIAARLQPTDSQRICRAWEVWQTTGTPLSVWQQLPSQKLHDFTFEILHVDLPKHELDQRIWERLEMMIAQEVIDEVADFAEQLAQRPSPLTKAVGYSELLAYVQGRTSLDDALARAAAATRQYAKRQRTWFKHQL
jgi:tRNA dimethylallyltransferase